MIISASYLPPVGIGELIRVTICISITMKLANRASAGYFVSADFGDDYKPLAQLFDQGAGSFVPFRPAASCKRSMRPFRPTTADRHSPT
ncbi:hypothetical protein XhyaCFBP1156_21095 [Xanthomonas hyacinthi]|uniref:Uncharacterized protein n=2 Tax=Xanthomonas hyacinthi TaxID=56455 RepID=A0A2S7EMY0_9XANT|nr:hypothetical protein XhyaCFBP1156_21095 [Xanthomonas hyacinthi]